MAKITLITPAQFIATNPKDPVDADKAIKKINDNLRSGKTSTLFSGKDEVNPLGKNYAERIAIIKSEFEAIGWTVTVSNNSEGTLITLSAVGI